MFGVIIETTFCALCQKVHVMKNTLEASLHPLKKVTGQLSTAGAVSGAHWDGLPQSRTKNITPKLQISWDFCGWSSVLVRPASSTSVGL